MAQSALDILLDGLSLSTKMLFVLALVFHQLDSDAFDIRFEPTSAILTSMTAVVGRPAVIPCNSRTNNSVRWGYTKDQSGKGENIELYSNDNVVNGHAARFEVPRLTEGDFTLTIRTAVMGDSGMYECWDDNGVGETVTRTVLTVINSTEDTSVAASSSTLGAENHVTQKIPQDTASVSSWTTLGAGNQVYLSPTETEKIPQDKKFGEIVLGVTLSLVVCVFIGYVMYIKRHEMRAKFDALIHAKNHQQPTVSREINEDGPSSRSPNTNQLSPLLHERAQHSGQSIVNVISHQSDETTVRFLSAPPAIQIDVPEVDECVPMKTGHIEESMPENDDQTAISLHEDEPASQSTDNDDETQQPWSAIEQPDYVNRLAVEMLELVLMKSFATFYTGAYKSSHRTRTAVARAYSTVAAVCGNWMHTLKGWPQSSTKHWVRHKLRRAIESACRPYAVLPRRERNHSVRDVVFGLTVCDGKLVVAYTLTGSVDVFELDNLQLLKSIQLNGLKHPQDIVACTETRNLYIAGHKEGNMQCVWRVSPHGNVAEWLPDNFIAPHARSTLKYLSIRSRRLLVACSDTNTIIVYGPDAAELMRVSSSAFKRLGHAVETSRGTFFAIHLEPKPSISEIDSSGNVIRSFDDTLMLLKTPFYLALDTEDRVFVLDKSGERVLLFCNDLTMERILLEKKDMGQLPLRMCYDETVGRLFVGDSYNSVRAFSIRSLVQH